MVNALIGNYYQLLILQSLDIGLTLGVIYYEYYKSKDWKEASTSERNPVALLMMRLIGPKHAWWVFPPVMLYLVYKLYWYWAEKHPCWTFFLFGVFIMVVFMNTISLVEAIKYWRKKK